MRNFSLSFTVIVFSCMSVIIWLSQPGNIKNFRQTTFSDLILHETILPNLLVFIILLWVFIWLVIPREIKKLRIEPLFKLKIGKHIVGLSLIFFGVILQYLIVVLPESIKSSKVFPLASVVIVMALLIWWLSTIVYAALPNDYKKGILFILSFIMIFLSVLQTLTYFIKL